MKRTTTASAIVEAQLFDDDVADLASVFEKSENNGWKNEKDT
jgi:hypothetical protein